MDQFIQSISRKVYFIRGHRRFPEDFMFQLIENEEEFLRCQSGISKRSTQRGGRRYLPLVFTEQGVAMLSSVLRSERAVLVNIEIMRTFVRLREILLSHQDLARQLFELEKKYDAQFSGVFDAIRELMMPPEPKRRKMGFHADEDVPPTPLFPVLRVSSIEGLLANVCTFGKIDSGPNRFTIIPN